MLGKGFFFCTLALRVRLLFFTMPDRVVLLLIFSFSIPFSYIMIPSSQFHISSLQLFT